MIENKSKQLTKVAVFTGTRAEYGLLYWLMKEINSDPELLLQIIVSGMHLSHEFGETFTAIEKDGFSIDEKVENLLSSNTKVGVAKSIGLGVVGLSDALTRLNPDVLVILGDRFEALAAAQTALILRIPILHLHGGEITEGAYDDSIRHAITKFSYLHCTSTEQYKNRVIQLGEEPYRVKNVGAIGLENIRRLKLMSLKSLEISLDVKNLAPYFLVTYHPATIGDEQPKKSFNAMIAALSEFKDHKILITYPNADDGGREIISLINSTVKKNPTKVIASPSLGQLKYLSAMKHASLVVGNSSSGIIEAPFMGVPSINIGTRQKGRLAGKSVIHCLTNKQSIVSAVKSALRFKFTNNIKDFSSPYGDGYVTDKVIKIIKDNRFNIYKRFYNLNMEEAEK